jgi:hypothetical protein
MQADELSRSLDSAIGLMMSLAQQAGDMMSGSNPSGVHVGPSFEYQPLDPACYLGSLASGRDKNQAKDRVIMSGGVETPMYGQTPCGTCSATANVAVSGSDSGSRSGYSGNGSMLFLACGHGCPAVIARSLRRKRALTPAWAAWLCRA